MPPALEARRVQARRAFCVTGVLQPMPGIGLDTFESDLIRFQLIPSTRIPRRAQLGYTGQMSASKPNGHFLETPTASRISSCVD